MMAEPVALAGACGCGTWDTVATMFAFIGAFCVAGSGLMITVMYLIHKGKP